MTILPTGFTLRLAAAQGEVYVARGNTLVISGTPIRLLGVDLAEGRNATAENARRQVQDIVAKSFVACRLTGESISNQMLGTCTADGKDIAATLVSRGLALDCERWSDGRYRALEPEGSRDRLQASGACRP